MKQKLQRSSLRLLGLGIFLSLTALVRGQGTIALSNLLVEIWPEYDRAETLVIYQGELSGETPLPARLTFALPGHIETMHVVAVEQNGDLFEVDSAAITLRREADVALLSFSSPAARFQFEYYDPLILKQEGATRLLDFQFSPSYPIDAVTFEVQEPLDATDFSMTPPAENSFTGANGLQYHTVQRTPLTPADTFELSTTYRRQTDALSAPNLSNGDPAAPPPEANSSETAANGLRFGYLLIGVGVVLLLISGGSWIWSRRRTAPQPRRPARKVRREANRRKQTAGGAAQATSSQKDKLEGKFCYRCGGALRQEANFCHSCGAERRYD